VAAIVVEKFAPMERTASLKKSFVLIPRTSPAARRG
jgi:hypothetical protein